MNQSIAHRGPDAEGMVANCENTLALGHRRLSIIDLDNRSNQPFKSESENSYIVFNGEIYNYIELRNKLPYSFQTNSDTEVLLAGLELFGIDWIRNCNGMFAFAFYSKNSRKLFLCRDRFGIKPLYYYKDSKKFIFSSEIKGVLNSGLVRAVFNEAAVDEYLGNRYVREPYTFFENIYQLPAGCYMTVDEHLNTEIHQYWELPREFNNSSSYNEETIYGELKLQVEQSIKRRMISDVPLGTYLSGGIDSSLITAIAAKNTGFALNTYTIGFDELNEFGYADMVAKAYETKHHEIHISADNYFENMKELITYKDSPLGVPNEVPLALMSKELKKDITVVLSGEGADELMGGYGKIFRSAFDYENHNTNQSFYQYFIDKYEYVPRKIRDEYLQTPIRYRNQFDSAVRETFSTGENKENIFRFFHKYHVKGLLQRVDITTMYAGVEARVPFLDHQLVEFVYKNVPYELKLKWNSAEVMEKAKAMCANDYSEQLDQPKYLLRKMGLEYLPELVVTRRKMGFPVPLNNWIGNLEDIGRNCLKGAYWLKKGALDSLIGDLKKNQRAGQLLWMFINIELFRQIYFEKEWMY